VFGSDWPHPEGMKEPLNFVDDIADLSEEDRAKIMGGNMMKLFKIPSPVPA
ncbi:amidohydrolase family protein, partial [Mycobacterium sp.]|uniref:amidohydrolase family protein n=1 Tax=Mycobacterium sp. TaxID=1785 RepID=UPI003C77B77A